MLSNDSGYSIIDSFEKIGWFFNVFEVGFYFLYVLCFCVIKVCVDLWKSFFVWFMIFFFNVIFKEVILLERFIFLYVFFNFKFMLLCYIFFIEF